MGRHAVLGRSCAMSSSSTPGQRNFRIFGPDETLSNVLGAVFEARTGSGMRAVPKDEFLAPQGAS